MDSQVHDICRSAAHRAEQLRKSVQVLADTLAARMKEIHGDDFRINIDHTTRFVLLAPSLKSEAAIQRPRGGELA